MVYHASCKVLLDLARALLVSILITFEHLSRSQLVCCMQSKAPSAVSPRSSITSEAATTLPSQCSTLAALRWRTAARGRQQRSGGRRHHLQDLCEDEGGARPIEREPRQGAVARALQQPCDRHTSLRVSAPRRAVQAA